MAKIAIYNVDKKELVGLFSGPAFAGRYLYAGVYSLKKCQKLSSASRKAARLRDKPKGFIVKCVNLIKVFGLIFSKARNEIKQNKI